MTVRERQRWDEPSTALLTKNVDVPGDLALPDTSALKGMDRSFAVLKLLADSPMRVVDVTRSLEMPWATVHRTLVQLEKAQFLRRDPETNRYHIGPRLWHIGSAYLATHRVLSIATAYIARLSDIEGVALQIVERIGSSSVVIYSHQHTDEDVNKAHYGYHFPLHCGSKGHILLAYADPEFIEGYLAGPLKLMTSETVTDPDELRSVLADVRAKGYAFTIGDIQLFNASMAAPIRDHTGQVVAGLCFVFRKNVVKSANRREALQERLCQTAQAVSLDLGWRPDR